jgi:N-acylneuraminate cytidylyltransferase
MNPWWSFIKNKDGRAKPLFPFQLKKRSQDLPILYCPTGAIWIAKAKKLIKSKTFYGKDSCFEELNWISSVDIDDYADLDFAKILKKHKKNFY